MGTSAYATEPLSSSHNFVFFAKQEGEKDREREREREGERETERERGWGWGWEGGGGGLDVPGRSKHKKVMQ